MRNMSFALTTAQFRARTKIVTRRNGWLWLKAGDQVMGVEKSQGLKPGESIVRLGPIGIVNARREPLLAMFEEDEACAKEGFPEWDVQQFIDFYCAHNKIDAHDDITRIEFAYLD